MGPGVGGWTVCVGMGLEGGVIVRSLSVAMANINEENEYCRVKRGFGIYLFIAICYLFFMPRYVINF